MLRAMGRPRKQSIQNGLIAIAYLRVSTEDQTVDQQRDLIERWAKANGVRVAEWLADEGVSGAAPLDERPAFLAALAALRTHGAGLLVAAKRDRFARDIGTAAAIERLVSEAGAKVVTADGVDSSDTPEGQLMRAIIDAMAQYERALIRARTKGALAAKKKRGEVVGQVPFGWRASEGRLERVPSEQRAIDRARRLRSQGRSYRVIAEVLESEGHRPRGERWHVTTVQRLLRAP
jgi:DNA invertase Pin-like site-specific DNA recombinase